MFQALSTISQRAWRPDKMLCNSALLTRYHSTNTNSQQAAAQFSCYLNSSPKKLERSRTAADPWSGSTSNERHPAFVPFWLCLGGFILDPYSHHGFETMAVNFQKQRAGFLFFFFSLFPPCFFWKELPVDSWKIKKPCSKQTLIYWE